MPAAPNNHDAYDNAERILERLPRHLQKLREAVGLSSVHLARERGISRDAIGGSKGVAVSSRLHRSESRSIAQAPVIPDGKAMARSALSLACSSRR
jgi:hypothetical protein